MRFLLLVLSVDMIAMAIEYEIESKTIINLARPLGSVRHNERDKSA